MLLQQAILSFHPQACRVSVVFLTCQTGFHSANLMACHCLLLAQWQHAMLCWDHEACMQTLIRYDSVFLTRDNKPESVTVLLCCYCFPVTVLTCQCDFCRPSMTSLTGSCKQAPSKVSLCILKVRKTFFQAVFVGACVSTKQSALSASSMAGLLQLCCSCLSTSCFVVFVCYINPSDTVAWDHDAVKSRLRIH